nr:hypothetical protein [Tanacetum cinerariifolium]
MKIIEYCRYQDLDYVLEHLRDFLYAVMTVIGLVTMFLEVPILMDYISWGVWLGLPSQAATRGVLFKLPTAAAPYKGVLFKLPTAAAPYKGVLFKLPTAAAPYKGVLFKLPTAAAPYKGVFV